MITCTFEDGGKGKLRHTCVDAIATNGKNEILLIKRSEKYSKPNKYALPGGYLSRDENLKSGVLRELYEETGYKGEVISLFCINDNEDEKTRKDDRQNVVPVFLIQVTEGETKVNDEVNEVGWFSEEELPSEDDFAFDHRRILSAYFNHLRLPQKLPLFAEDFLI